MEINKIYQHDVMQPWPIQATTLAYLAGAMDSDGYFTIKRSTYGVRYLKDSKSPTYSEKCGIKQVTPDIIDLIHYYFGGSRRIDKPNCKAGKLLYVSELTHSGAVRFIEAILPYLRIKKRQALIVLKLTESKKQGKLATTVTVHNCRWNKDVAFTKRIVSPEQVEYRESLISEIKSLNDSRSGPKHTSIPWR
jgi:hypothetical protein